jgi:putative ABC transport system substrate-binding protein
VNVTEKVPAAKPGDLPVAQLDRPHFVINLKTPKALGLTIPPSVLQRADQVMPVQSAHAHQDHSLQLAPA